MSRDILEYKKRFEWIKAKDSKIYNLLYNEAIKSSSKESDQFYTVFDDLFYQKYPDIFKECKEDIVKSKLKKIQNGQSLKASETNSIGSDLDSLIFLLIIILILLSGVVIGLIKAYMDQ